jgi:hypothetical protein
MTGLDFPYFPLWEDGLVPPVDPSDLKSAWKRGQELRAQYGSEPAVVSLDLRGNCSPGGRHHGSVVSRVDVRFVSRACGSFTPGNA